MAGSKNGEAASVSINGAECTRLITVTCSEGRIGVYYTAYVELTPVMSIDARGSGTVFVKILEPGSKFDVAET